MSRVNNGPECPECGSTRRSTCGTASMDTNGNRIRMRLCQDCETSYTTLEVSIPFSFSGADSLKRGYHGTTSPIRRTTDAFMVQRGKVPDTWVIRLKRGVESNYCRRGLHELTGDNVYLHPNGQRVCNPCRRATTNKHYRHRIDRMPAVLKDELREQRRLDSARRLRRRRAA